MKRIAVIIAALCVAAAMIFAFASCAKVPEVPEASTGAEAEVVSDIAEVITNASEAVSEIAESVTE